MSFIFEWVTSRQDQQKTNKFLKSLFCCVAAGGAEGRTMLLFYKIILKDLFVCAEPSALISFVLFFLAPTHLHLCG